MYLAFSTNSAFKILTPLCSYQSRKRGILECDLILSNFAQQHLNQLTTQQLDAYDQLLDEQDWDLYYWITGDAEHPVPEHILFNTVFQMLQKHVEERRYSKDERGSGMFRMPDLSTSSQ
jgi:succinate dehydrogenase assembly factor 2